MSIKRIIAVTITAVFMFVALSVLFKLVLGNSNWLLISSIWTASWIIGSFAAIFFCRINAGTIALLLYNVGLIAFVLIIMAFILGVVLNLSGWEETVAIITIPFAMAIFSNVEAKK